MTQSRRPVTGTGRSGGSLLLAPPQSPYGAEACIELLTADGIDTPSRNVLIITSGRADACLNRWTTHCDTTANEIAVLTDIPMPDALSSVDGSVSVHDVPDFRNLTQLGVEITTILDRWADDERPIVACFDSLTALVQRVDQQLVLRFLTELIRQFVREEAFIHFHVDPSAHDRKTIAPLYQVVETVVTPTDDASTIGSKQPFPDIPGQGWEPVQRDSRTDRNP